MKFGKKKILSLVALCLAFGLSMQGVGLSNNQYEGEDTHFVVVIPSYNNKQWYEKNLDSLLKQTYRNYDVVYIDDCSSDGTGNLVRTYVEAHRAQEFVTLIKNKKRVGALANIYNIVHACKNSDVIILLDGDDWLAHENVLLKLNELYSVNKCWVAYTQFIQWPMEQVGWNKSFSSRHYQSPDSPRDYSPSHLRTFYAGLFKKIKKEDLMYEGDFFAMTWDMAIMLPMVEMASNGHVKFVPEIMYIYNHSNPISDHVVNLDLQKKLHGIIAAKKKYVPISCLCDK